MDKIKNVVIVNDFDYIQGGASKVAIDTANMLVDQYNVYFFSAVHNDNTTLDERVIRISTNQGEALKDKNRLRGIFNGLYNSKAKKELRKLLSTLDKNETIIHMHGWTKALSSSVFDMAFKLNFKVVLTLHDYFTICPNGGLFNYKKNCVCTKKPMSLGCIFCNCDSRNYFFKIYRVIRQHIQNKTINKKLKHVIAISDFSEKIFKNNFKDVNMYRVYNPIEFAVEDKIKDYKKNEYFLYVGRVSKEKGTEVFCKAITKANKKGIVVGDGPELDRLKDEYKNIKFVGWKNTIEVKKYILEAKCLIFPSVWYETMGMTVIEAQKCGLPVIVNKNTAASEFVKDDRFKYEKFEELIEIINNFDEYDFDFYTYKNDYVKDLISVYKKI